MDNHFNKIASKEDFDELLARSKKEPIVILKHSLACPVSSSAYRELKDFPGEVALLEIQNSRELSREIERLTGVSHESPQVIILRNGEPVWHASHWKVTAHAVEQAMRENA
jgi:bacillithiol system protein YtxJ